MPDVFVYDELPEKLLNQIVHIWTEAIGPFNSATHPFSRAPSNNETWNRIHKIIAKQHGLPFLDEEHLPTYERCVGYLRSDGTSIEYALDLIEASFMYVDGPARELGPHERKKRGITMCPDDAIQELNDRFRQACVGYRFENGMILQVDSELIHYEVVRPALRYLRQPGFEGPSQEFMSAHAHYRAGQMKDAITDANNAFESTLKTICDLRGWQDARRARAVDLLKIVRNEGLLPDYLDESFNQLVATLKSGLPRVRNEEGAHGQGAIPHQTPDYVAAYALHLAAAKILFLVEAHNALSPPTKPR